MPELPEVETIRRDLADAIVGRRLMRVVVNKPKMIKGESGVFINTLTGNVITKIERRGKLLILHLKKEGFLLLHLKMTGQLIYQEKGRVVAGGHSLPKKEDNLVVPNRYSHIHFYFEGGGALFFNDLRQFGYAVLVDAAGKEAVLAAYGPEPLGRSFTVAHLQNCLASKRLLKAVLLDQHLIAGIGNIYADEACFLARLRPDRRADSLNEDEIGRLRDAVVAVLKLAVLHRGTTFSDYKDGRGQKGGFQYLLSVYGRTGQPCPRHDGGAIRKTKLAGRGTHFCPICQQ